MSATTRPLTRAVQYITSDVALEIRADAALPPGVCGRVSGVALTYDVVDSYATVFAPGCAKRSIDTKVRARKVPLLMDHSRTVGAHVGVVAQMTDAGNALVMTADLFDTPDGRAALEYAKTVIAAGASTGFSIGFVPRRSDMTLRDGQMVEVFQEIELREVSLTPMPAVPGADVMGARTDEASAAIPEVAPEVVPEVAPDLIEPDGQPERSDVELLATAARVALEALPADVRTAVVARFTSATPAPLATPPARSAPADAATVPAPASTGRAVPMAHRLDAVRRSYAIPRGTP